MHNLEGLARHIHLMVSVRCGRRSWWEHDLWDLRVDDRIPRRPHEPGGYKTIDLGAIEPPWLREGVRYWLRQTLTTQMYRWTTAVGHTRQISTYFANWLTHAPHDPPLTGPAIADDPAGLRLAFLEFLAWLQPLATSLNNLATGVNLTIRNPATHCPTEYSEQEAMEQLAAISYLARLLDRCEIVQVHSEITDVAREPS